jgi:CheY-like chemotaxis protein
VWEGSLRQAISLPVERTRSGRRTKAPTAARDFNAAQVSTPDGARLALEFSDFMTHILAIEPDTRRGALLRELVLEHLQADLVLVSSTGKAITAITASAPDLILTSMLLSANEEQDLVAHLRATPSLRHIPVLTVPAVTAPSAPETRSGGLFARFRRRREPTWPMYNFNAVITRIEEALEQSNGTTDRIE